MARGDGFNTRRRGFPGGGRRRRMAFYLPAGMKWYDCVMIPLLVIGALWGVTHLDTVLLTFFKANIAVLDVISIFGVLAVIVAIILFFFTRRRRY